MTETDTPPPAATHDRSATAYADQSSRVLDPVSRASEILFGLIMVLTFTLSLRATSGHPADVRVVLAGMLGCNLAWGVIDAVMYLLDLRGERHLAFATILAIKKAKNPDAGCMIVADYLPPALLPALTASDLERIRVHLTCLPPDSLPSRFSRKDYLASLGVFLLVFLCLFPVAAPFLFIDDVALALMLSNAVALGMLFLTGFAFGKQVQRPWHTGFLMIAIGIALVAVAVALGG